MTRKEGEKLANAAEFEEFWNTLSDEHKEEFFAAINGAFDDSYRCILQNHKALMHRINRYEEWAIPLEDQVSAYDKLHFVIES